MRLFVIVSLALAGLVFAMALDSREALKKYGAPDVERYRVTSEVSVTVSYGRDRTICELLIQRRPSSILHDETKKDLYGISSVVVDKLLSELVPESARRGTPRIMHQQMGVRVTTSRTTTMSASSA